MSTIVKHSGIGLKDFFLDLRIMHFTGEAKFFCPGCTKSVFIQSGEITHCSSSLLDDRLGDVIYREGKISLDLFVEMAGRVTDKFRFGDLLIQKKIFTLVELWDALNSQSKAILQSLVFHELLDVQLIASEGLKKPDFGLRFHWYEAIDEAVDELRQLRRFERAVRNEPLLSIDERNRSLVDTDFLRDMVSLVEEHKDFNVIVDQKSQLSKVYTTRALFEMYIRGIISDSWNIFAQDLSHPTEHELQEVVKSSNRVFRKMEELAERNRLADWDEAVMRAVRILEREFGPGVFLVPKLGFSIQHLRKIIAYNKEFRVRATLAQEHRWPASIVAFIQEGLHKAILYLLYEISNTREIEEDLREIYTDLDDTRGSYFSRVAEAIS